MGLVFILHYNSVPIWIPIAQLKTNLSLFLKPLYVEVVQTEHCLLDITNNSQINTYKASNTKLIWNKQKMFHNHREDSPNKTHLQTTNKHLSEVKGGAIFCTGIINLLITPAKNRFSFDHSFTKIIFSLNRKGLPLL